MFTTAGSPRTIRATASNRRRRLLAGAGGAALALSLLPAQAWAHDYTVSTEAELRQAILDANADGDATSTITLTADIAIAGTLPESTKALIINTAGFSTNGITPQGVVTLAGTIKGNNDLAGGNGQNGLTISGPVTTTVTNNAAVTGGDGTGATNTGLGVDLQDGTLTNNGTITGGSSGGPASIRGGFGMQVSRVATVINNGTIQGGTGLGVTGGTGAFIGVSPSTIQTFTNNATGIVRGGDGTGGALGGVAIEVKTISVPIINHGLIEGGNGAAAIKSAPNVNIINDGTIRAGAGGLIAIDASTSQLTTLELRAGYSITGQVIANAAHPFAQTLQFGGSVDAGFDMSSVGAAAQYRNFDRILKTGTSIWTLTGDVSGMPTTPWILRQGTLLFDQNTAAGAVASMINDASDNAALIFQQDSTLSVGSLNGAISVLQDGSGMTILTGNNHSLGTTLASGTLSIGDENALGSGAFTITGGKLQWSGNGSIARSIGWAASGAEIEVTGTALTLAQPLLGGGALTKSGGGTLTLNGDNSYTGGTTITAGTLRVNGSILGDVLDNGTLIFGNSTAYSYAGLVTGTGNLNAAGAGLLTLTADSNYDGTTTISGAGGLLVTGGADIAYGGTTTLSAGQLLINAGATMTSGGAMAMTSNNATFIVDGAGSAFSTASMNVAGSTGRVMAVNVTNGGHLDLTAAGMSIRTLLGTARFTIDGTGSLVDMTGGLTLAGTANTGAALTISGGGALVTDTASTVGAAAGNTQNGTTRLLDVTIMGAGSNWTSASSLLMSNGNFTLDQGGVASFASATFGTAAGAFKATLIVSGGGSTLTTTGGDLVIGSGAGTGELTLSGGGSVDVTGSLVLADGATATGILSIGGAEGQAAAGAGAFTAPTLSFGSTTSRLNFNHTDIDYGFATMISGAGLINQVAGDTNLTGTSTAFTGTTNVTGGSLRVNGTLGSAASVVNVSNGGRLGGAGTIGGDVFITDGVLAPGNSPGTLTIAGNLSLTGASLLDYEFGHSDVVGGPLNDLTQVGGDLTLAGTINVTVTPGGSFDPGVYRVISYGGSLTDNGLAIGTVPGGSLVQVQTSVLGQVNLVNHAGIDVNFWDGGGTTDDGVVSGGTGIWQNAAANDHWTLIDGSLNTAYPNDAFAVFMAAGGTVTVDASGGAINASGMQFASDGYTITGDAIGLTGSQSTIRVGDGTAAGAGYTATIASNFNGAGDLLKTDLGTLVLTGANSIAGDIYVRSGALQLPGGGTLGNVNGLVGPYAGDQATVTVTGAGSAWNNSDTLWVGYDGTGTLNVTNGGLVTSGTGMLGVTAGGSGTALISGTGSSWQNSGRISLGLGGTGNLRIEGGATVSSNDGVIGSDAQGDAVVTGAGSAWTNAMMLTVGNFGAGTLRIEDGATVTSNQGYVGASADGSVTVTGTGSSWVVSTYNIAVGYNANGSLTIEDGGLVHAAGGIFLGGSAGVDGILTLQGTAANRAVLETSGIQAGLGNVILTLDGALLRATADTGLFFDGFDGQDITIGANGLAFDTDGHAVFVSPNFIGSGALIKDGAGALVLSGDSAYGGGTIINAGSLQIGTGGTTGSITGDVVDNGDLSFFRSDAISFGGLISGGGSVTHFGPGTLTLTGTNSYTGATNVSNDGTLLINGDQSAATGLTTVAAAAALGGTGIIGGSVDMSAGGTLTPGSGGAGTLTINGNLTLGAASTLAFELGQAGTAGGALNDLVDVGGNLTLDGTIDIATSAGGTYGIGIYRVLNYAGTLTDNGLLVGSQPAGAETFVQTSVAGQVNLVNIGGLTLNFWDGAAGPKFDGAIGGGDGVWQSHVGNDNWTDLNGALNAGFSDGAVAIFGGNAGTVAVDNSLGAVTASGMQFATNGYTLTGDAVTLTGAQAVIRVGDGSAAGAGYVATIGSTLSGASQLVKTDLGTLVLTGTNSYAGGTRIEGGTLQLGNGGATGSITGDIVNNAALVVNRTGTLTLDGAISGSGSLAQTGGGTLILSGANSYAGGTTIGGASTLQIASDANLGDAAGLLTLQGATLRAGASFLSGRRILLSGASNLIDTQGFNVTLGGTIGDGTGNAATNALVKFGTGTLTLTAVNSYANRTQITQGTLALAGAGTIGAGDLAVDAGTVFDISQANIGARVNQLASGAAGTITLGSKALTLGAAGGLVDWSGTIADGGIGGGTGGSVTIDAAGGTVRFQTAQSYSGGTLINAGTFALVGNGGLYAGGAVAVNAGATFDIAGLTGSGTTIGDLSGAGALALGGKALTFGTANDSSFTGVIAGNGGSLVKSGSGTFILTGANSYNGTTSVNAGTLLVNGDQSAAIGLTSVASGATLGGSGVIGGNVAIADGGTLSPGNGPGTLTIKGGLTLSGGSALAYELGEANAVGGALNDLVNVGGNLVLDGTINVSVPVGGTFGAGIYRVFNYGGTLTDNGLALGALPAGSTVLVQTSVAGQVNLVNYAGFTFNFWDGTAGPKNNSVINGGTGVWQNGTGNDNWADATGVLNARYSDGAFAVFVGAAGTVTVDNSLGQVAASGMQFATGGYVVTGGAIALAGAQAVIRVGDGSAAGAGYTATVNAALSGASQLVKTDAGTLILGGTNSYTGGTLITGGTVQISSDANLGAAAGAVTFDGGVLTTMSSMSTARGIVLQGAGTFSTAAGTTLTLGGALSGNGPLTKSGTGTLVVTGNNLAYAGAANVAAGTLAVTGSLGSAITLDAGTRLEGTGTVGSVTNSGTIAPGMGGFGTLTLAGNYASNNGTLEIEAELAGDGSQADRLVVGGTTSGSTLVKVTNMGGTGAPTIEGIKIVDVAGASNGAFTLDGDYVFEGAPALVAGAYAYRLVKNGVASPTDGDWYLRSSLLSPVTPPSNPNVPLYQPGVPVYEAYGQTLATLNAIGTMQERVGNRRWSSGSDGISGIWGRTESARNRPNAVQSTSLSDVNVDSWKSELGIDQVISTRSDGARLVLGVLGSYGEARASIASLFGNGSIRTRGYTAGATLTWFGPQGFYVDGRAQVSWFDSKLKSSTLGTLADSNKGTGQAYSLEVGKRAPLSATLSLTPQIQMAYSTTGFDRFTDPNGAQVSSRLGDSLKTRWGISLDRQDDRSHAYAVVNLSYEWLDGTVTEVSGTPIARSNDRLWGELGFGGSVLLGKQVTLFSELSVDTAIHDFGDSYGLKGVAGLRLAF